MLPRYQIVPCLRSRMSRRQLLRSALAGAGGLATLALAGCDEDGGGARPTATLAPTALPSGAFDSSGVPIHYEVIGEGKPIVLVHGFSTSFQVNWVATGWVEELRPLRQVIGLDARGHGESGKPHEPEPYAGDEMANDVVRLLDHLGIEKADLFGYSMGASISLRLLASHSERFTSVIMGGIGDFARRVPGSAPGNFGAMIADALLTDDPSSIENPTAAGFRALAEALGNDMEALAAYMLADREGVSDDELAGVDLPVLIVNGAEDTLAGSADSLAAAIPGAEFVTIPERDHLTVVSDPQFKETVVRFLKEQNGAS